MKQELADYLNKETDKLKAKQRAELAPHAPGPWTTDGESIWGGDKACIAHVYTACAGCRPTRKTAKANARLIAAAPELLEACGAIIRMNYINPQNPMAIKLKLIISKATNPQP